MSSIYNVPTAHINAKVGDFSDTVIMPGDPLRAQYIAQHFLTDAKEVTNVRGMLGFTGHYQGRRVSVMGHGMGIPSCSIYMTELYQCYAVANIIRVGSCGAISHDVKVRDIIIAMGASTDSGVNRTRFGGYDLAALSDFGLLEQLVASARKHQLNAKVGNVFSSDLFYSPDGMARFDMMEKYGILGVEMEVAGLFGLAAEFGKKAAAVCTVSDHIRTGEQLSAELRATSFNEMIEMTLDATLRI